MTFQTVEQLQAQIASLTGEVERLRKDMPVSFVNLVFDVSRLTAENERLREALHFVLSWAEPIAGDGSNLTEYEIWEEMHSIELARAALQPKEGNQ